jgi:hypothetical protein
MQASGRHWADEAYKNKEYIFQYSAASIATFIHHNPKLQYTIYTDDTELLFSKLKNYKVDLGYLDVVDAKEKIKEWTEHSYCFWPLVKVAEMHHDGINDAIKLDNDLTCLKPLDEILEHKGALVWKYERLCSKGRDYWGESYAARNGLGTDNFNIYNMGVLGLTKEYHKNANRVADYCTKLINVDISPIHRFPDKPGTIAKVFASSEQVAVNYYFHVENIPILETHPWIQHWCYEKNKNGVLDSAQYLLK